MHDPSVLARGRRHGVRPRTGRSRAALLAASLVALLLALILGALGVRWVGAKRREAELLAIAAAGQPVLPADLETRADARPDPGPWLVRVAAFERPFAPGELTDVASYAALRQRARHGELGPELEAAFEELDACAGTEGGPVAIARVLAVLEARDGIVEPPPCGLAAVRLLARGRAGEIELAREAAAYAEIDGQEITHALEANSAVVPQLPAVQLIELRMALHAEVLRGAWGEEPESALAALDAQRELARVGGSAPLLIGYLVWASLQHNRLDSLELLLPRLPRDVDLADLEAELTALRPRGRAILALEGERAFGNRAFHEVRSGRATLPGPAPGLFRRLSLSFDQATYLGSIRDAIDRLGHAFHSRPPREEPSHVRRWIAPYSQLLTPSTQGVESLSDRLEARLALARAALVAFRGGAQELLPWIGKSVDPYDGNPLRCALSGDGLTVLWSVGPDRVDDGGNDGRDVVWRLKLR